MFDAAQRQAPMEVGEQAADRDDAKRCLGTAVGVVTRMAEIRRLRPNGSRRVNKGRAAPRAETGAQSDEQGARRKALKAEG